MDPSGRYPSPSSSTPQSGRVSPMKQLDLAEICVRTDGPPPAKRRKVAAPKPRTTHLIDLESRTEEDEAQLDRLMSALRKKKKIVVVAGAGISVSAGIPDFRSTTGLFSTLRGQHKLKSSGKHLFDASVYKHDSSTSSFHSMVRELAHMTSLARPTPFHHMLASIAEEGRLLRLYSQNVDCIDTQIPPLVTNVPLNLKGPWPVTIQLHGGLEKMVCSKCGHIEAFNGSLFEGPHPPPCNSCREQDEVRTTFAGKRSHGIGRMRPRIVLYNEYNPDEEAIGNVSQADLRKVPDAVIVVGTSLKIPGVRRLVKELCQVTRSRRDGLAVWINVDAEPQGSEFKDCWDLVIRGKCDDVADLANLPRWNEQDIGTPEAYMVSEDDAKRRQIEEALKCREVNVVLEVEKRPHGAATETAAAPASDAELMAEADKPKVTGQPRSGILTPGSSPKPRHRLPAKQPPKTAQSKLVFGSSAAPTGNGTAPQKAAKPRQPRQARKKNTPKPKPKPKPSNALTQAFKSTKSGTISGDKKEATPKREGAEFFPEPYSSDLSSPPPVSPPSGWTLPSLRVPAKPSVPSYVVDRPGTPPSRHRRASASGTISPPSKPRLMERLID